MKRQKMLFIYYPRCSTCQKAKKWLDENGFEYDEQHIVEDNPDYNQLKVLYEKVDYISRGSSTLVVKFTERCN